MRAGDGSILAALLGVAVVLSPVLDRAAIPSAPEALTRSIRPTRRPGDHPIARALARRGAVPGLLRSAFQAAPIAVATSTTEATGAPIVREGDDLGRLDAIADRGVALVARADGTLAPASGSFALDGRALVVHVAASWCRPCADDLPTFAALAARVPRAVLIMAEDLGGPASLAAAAELLAERAAPTSRAWPPGLELRADPDWAWAARLGSDTLPLTAVILPDGRIALVATGALDGDAAARVASLAEGAR